MKYFDQCFHQMLEQLQLHDPTLPDHRSISSQFKPYIHLSNVHLSISHLVSDIKLVFFLIGQQPEPVFSQAVFKELYILASPK